MVDINSNNLKPKNNNLTPIDENFSTIINMLNDSSKDILNNLNRLDGLIYDPKSTLEKLIDKLINKTKDLSGKTTLTQEDKDKIKSIREDLNKIQIKINDNKWENIIKKFQGNQGQAEGEQLGGKKRKSSKRKSRKSKKTKKSRKSRKSRKK